MRQQLAIDIDSLFRVKPQSGRKISICCADNVRPMTTTGRKVQDLPNKWRSTHCFLLFIYCCGRRYVRYKRVRWSGDPCQKYLSLLWSFCGSALNDKRGQTDGRVGGGCGGIVKIYDCNLLPERKMAKHQNDRFSPRPVRWLLMLCVRARVCCNGRGLEFGE